MSVIKDISKQLGLSESTVKKIINDPFNFSDKTSREVLRLYNKTNAENKTGGTVIGVLIPKRPIFFWKDVAAGMNDFVKKSQKDIKLRFFYYTTDDRAPVQGWEEENCDGYIFYPLDGQSGRIEQTIEHRPCVIFNEESSAGGLFIGPDGYDEGKKAAGILKGKSIKHVAIVRLEGRATVAKRIEGFKDEIKRMVPDIKITVIQLGSVKEIAPAMLAKKLADSGYPDCVYMTTGANYIGGGAIAKLKDKTDKRMVLVGHELSQADKKYLADGTTLGYVIQDAYMQGYSAVELALKAVEGRSLRSVYIESKVVLAQE